MVCPGKIKNLVHEYRILIWLDYQHLVFGEAQESVVLLRERVQRLEALRVQQDIST